MRSVRRGPSLSHHHSQQKKNSHDTVPLTFHIELKIIFSIPLIKRKNYKYPITCGDRPDSNEVTRQTFTTTVGGLVGLNRPAVNALTICISHTAGCGVPDTTPALEIMYQYAQGEQKGLTATKKIVIQGHQADTSRFYWIVSLSMCLIVPASLMPSCTSLPAGRPIVMPFTSIYYP